MIIALTLLVCWLPFFGGKDMKGKKSYLSQDIAFYDHNDFHAVTEGEYPN